MAAEHANKAWQGTAFQSSLENLSSREKLDPKHKQVLLPAAMSKTEALEMDEKKRDDVEHMDEDVHEHTDAVAESKSGGSIVWELLQKGLKKAMGATRDQLEFTIKIRSMFDGFDQSGDGQLAGHELRKALRDMGVHVSKREMKSLMMRFDQNHDGEIDHAEFEDMVRDLIPPPEFDMGGIFLEQKLQVMLHETKNSGLQICRCRGHDSTKCEPPWQAAFQSMDTNGDKHLDGCVCAVVRDCHDIGI